MSDGTPGQDDGSRRDEGRSARGFSTRAIAAASRAPRLDQTPTSVPIYQTATFSAADADELGDVLGDPRSGYAYSRISNPTTAALGAAYAELASGAAGVAFASGMGAIHAALASVLRAGDRVVAPLAIYGSTRALLLHTFGGFGVRVDFVDTTDLEAVALVLAEAPTRVLYAETIANPTTFLADHAGLADLAHRTRRDVHRRQHVRVAVCLPATRAWDGPCRRIGDEVPWRTQRPDRRCRGGIA